MPKLKDWITAFRLRTLPLALSSIFMGSFIAAFDNLFRWKVLVLATLTTLFLQILSNLANDYGDFLSGADTKKRLGPDRMVQSGRISPSAMKSMIVVFGFLSLLSGILLLLTAFNGNLNTSFMVFVLLGLLAIVAAIRYTVGKNPYGYRGLGDWYVFLFFGLTGVIGTYYLHTSQLNLLVLLPASAIGLLSTGVLNVNNLRDEKNDLLSNKRTLVVLLGGRNGRIYHVILITIALLLLTLFTIFQYKSAWQWLFLITTPVFVKHVISIWRNHDHAAIDPELKRLALLTFFTVLLMGTGMVISNS